jgi:D-beta-D-heptose 7-phosphate kinase/D-beta-D-heptose 1-phosphate adenosyltransferase
MNTDVARLVTACAGLKTLVIGDAILDGYVEGDTKGLCREAPVPIIAVSRRIYAPGGAANAAANAASLGSEVTLVSLMGDDRDGDHLCRLLQQHGVLTDRVLRRRIGGTLVKHRILSSGHMMVRCDEGLEKPPDEAEEQQLIRRVIDLAPCFDVVIVWDYGYGVLTPLVIKALADVHRRSPRILVVDSRYRLASFRDIGVTAVKPNYDEVLRLVGEEERSPRRPVEWLASAGDRILALTGAEIAAVTLDLDGALLFERGRAPYRTYAHSAPHTCATGAGDTFISALALALAAGAHTPTAAEFASAAAAVVVAKGGTAVCSGQDVREFISADGKLILDLHRLSARVESYRRQGRRIAFTNGCFDLLHRGHIAYLSHAKERGDILIVAVNSDDSIRRLKGSCRPINPLDDRIQVLAALSCIDHLVTFDGDTPSDLLHLIRPDVYVKGGDYNRQTLPEAPLVEALGGRVEFLPYVEDQSTTGIIERVRNAGRRTRATHTAVT